MGFLSRFLKKQPERVREPQFAGHLYPKDAEALRERVERALDTHTSPATSLQALIVPFAQLDYIEHILGTCWALTASAPIERVVLLGSALRIPFQGLAMSTVNAWRSPLGMLWVDEVFKEQLESLELVRGIDAIHEHEPSLELQLPFIQQACKEDVTILPLLMGDGSTEQVRRVLEVVCARPNTLLVVATELGYGLPFDEGEETLRRVTDAILACDAQAIGRGDVTARHPVKALLEVAGERGWHVRHLGSTSSREAQEAHEEQLVIQDQGLMTGYAGFAFEG